MGSVPPTIHYVQRTAPKVSLLFEGLTKWSRLPRKWPRKRPRKSVAFAIFAAVLWTWCDHGRRGWTRGHHAAVGLGFVARPEGDNGRDTLGVRLDRPVEANERQQAGIKPGPTNTIRPVWDRESDHTARGLRSFLFIGVW